MYKLLFGYSALGSIKLRYPPPTHCSLQGDLHKKRSLNEGIIKTLCVCRYWGLGKGVSLLNPHDNTALAATSAPIAHPFLPECHPIPAQTKSW